MKPIQFQEVKPTTQTFEGVDNPTEVRYGWIPFKSVYLYNGDGTPYYYIQPVNSAYHREIPKNQLIPFETFTITKKEPSGDVEGAPGALAPYMTITTVKTAFEAATELLRGYSGRGYTVLNSLQGLPQETAFRIFAVVQPLDYKISELVSELSFAEERIESTEPIDLSHKVGESYFVQPLQNDNERQIARRLVSEMLDGAQRAEDFANDILEQTEKDLIATASGRKEGKKGADPLDKYLEFEMDRKLPNMFNKTDKTEILEQKIDFLVDREQTREMKEDNERLKEELAQLKAKQVELPPIKVGETVIAGEFVGVVESKPGGKYKVKCEDGTSRMFDRSDLSQ